MWIVTSAVLTLPAALLVLVNVPPLTDCRSETAVDSNQRWFRAARIVVQPWRGPHHVYGTFSVPDRYKRDRLYTAKLMIQGFTEEFTVNSSEGKDIDSGLTEPGHYMKQLYLPTRTALWFLLTGRFGDLRLPCHWWLVIADRVR